MRAVGAFGQGQNSCGRTGAGVGEHVGEGLAPTVGVLEEAGHARIVGVEHGIERVGVEGERAVVVHADAERGQAVDVGWKCCSSERRGGGAGGVDNVGSDGERAVGAVRAGGQREPGSGLIERRRDAGQAIDGA